MQFVRTRPNVIVALLVAASVSLAGCSSAGDDAPAIVVQGDAVPRSFVDEYLELDSIAGQPPGLTGDRGTDARSLLTQVVVLKIARQELLSAGYVEPAEVRQQVAAQMTPDAFVPKASTAFVDEFTDLVVTSEWIQNAGEIPDGAIQRILDRHPELAQRICYDAYIASTNAEVSAAKKALKSQDLATLPNARVDECLPPADLVNQPIKIASTLSEGRIGVVTGPLKIGEGDQAVHVWVRPRGAEVASREVATSQVEGLLAQPAQLATFVALLPGAVEVSSEFGGMLASMNGALSVSPEGVDAPVIPAATGQ